jgi:TldD protein
MCLEFCNTLKLGGEFCSQLGLLRILFYSSETMNTNLDRREFVKLAGAAGLTAIIGFPQTNAPGPDAAEKDLVMVALDAARSAGASYADVRITRGNRESVATRERQITNVSKSETYGIGVRALVGGSWGFAAARDLAKESVAAAARQAAMIAGSNDRVNPVKTVLAPVNKVSDGRWITPHEIDPFTIPIEQKADLLFKTNEEALRIKGVRFVTSSINSIRESRLLGTTDGSLIQQTFLRIGPNVNVTAVSEDNGDFQTRNANLAPRGAGWEYVVGLQMKENVLRWAEEAAAKLTATPAQPGMWDLVLHPSHLWLTIHESIGHPTELDRAMGYEANFAGTSFLSPPEKVLNKFRYGPALMNIIGNRTEAGGCSTCGWDDEGVPAQSWPIVDKGIFVNYQTTRELASWISNLTKVRESLGTSYGQDWASIPFPRMPNVSLQPNTQDVSEEEVIAATKRGIYIEGDGSYSIDQQRYNFQFGGQVFWEIKDGKRNRMLRDVAYQARTPNFWNSMALIGGKSTYRLGGALNDGKGQPEQLNAVSHGCPMALFRNVNVINTA